MYAEKSLVSLINALLHNMTVMCTCSRLFVKPGRCICHAAVLDDIVDHITPLYKRLWEDTKPAVIPVHHLVGRESSSQCELHFILRSEKHVL